MTDILMNKGVHEHKDGKSCIYVLEDEERFSQLGYKVMLSKKVTCLLSAAKVRHNGQTELIYIVKGYTTYGNLLPSMQRDSVFLVCAKILQAILSVKRQGFLACENIDVAIDRIYFDPKTYEAYLVYLPLAAAEDDAEARFEASVRHLLLQIIRQADTGITERERVITEALAGGGMDLENLTKLFAGDLPHAPASNAKKKLRLNSMNAGIQINVVMEQDELKIGRRKGNDVVLDFTKQISRDHCSLYREGDAYYVVDKKSAFGTGLNGKKLTLGKPEQLHDGDVLMLPGIKFKIQIV